jgi:hypothetical protein
MKKYSLLKSLIVSAVVFSLSACKTSPPVAPIDPVFNYGKIFVSSNVEGASIYIDDNNSGKVTPDTIQVIEGTRIIKLIKDGYIPSSTEVAVIKDSIYVLNLELTETTVNKGVLLEDFANVSCNPCVISNLITHSLAQQFGAKLHIVKFPTNFPKPNDPFYLFAKGDCDARMSFYNIITAPTVIIDGVTRPISSDSNDIRSAIEAALLEEPEFDLEVTNSVSGGNINITVKVTPLNTAGLNAGELRLYTAIVEKRIETAEPPGSNGETVFYDVLRKMLPAANGELISTANLNEISEYQRQVQIDASWNMNEITTIVYLQNNSTKKVIQAASAD